MSTLSLRSVRLLSILLGVALAAAPLTAESAAAPAAPGGSVKVGVIDPQQILTDSKLGKTALADLSRFKDQKEAEIQAKQSDLTNLEAQLDKQRLSLADAKIQELQSKIQTAGVELQRLQEDAQKQLTQKRDEVLARVDKAIMPIIDQLGQEQGYTLIFRKFDSGLVFADSRVDLTAEVVRRLDQTTPAAPAKTPR